MPDIRESTVIKDVQIVHLKAFGDSRGRFMETFRKEWFPQRKWDNIQCNRSDSIGGVLRGLHYHFKQIDYWYVPQGHVRAGLFDMRPGSPTFGKSQVVNMGTDYQVGLYIPVGVAHGYYAVTDAMFTYVVDNYYDNTDEFGIRWDDPDANVNWGVTGEALTSGRDEANPFFADVLPENLPKVWRPT